MVAVLSLYMCVMALLRVLSWMLQPKRSARYYAAMRLMEEPDEPFTPFALLKTPNDAFVSFVGLMLILFIGQMVKKSAVAFGVAKCSRPE